MATNRTSTPPPLHDLPTAKEKKYDRQLRLWGATGQQALEDTHILLINNGSGVTGVETLKNLVLPGIGHFTILDAAVVEPADLGVNFFLDDHTLGGFRAEHTARLLNELNPDVEGHFITEPLEMFVTRDKFLSPYTLVLVAAPIDPDILSIIQEHASALQTPIFYFHSLGFYSHFSVQLPPAFPIVDTHPDPDTTQDLRLLKPWPALIDFAQERTAGLDMMSAHEKGHIPYLLLLLHYLELWKETHDGKVPDSYKEKSAFRDTVRAGSADEENYDEAVAAVLKPLNSPTAPSAARDIFAAPECMKLTATSASFWLIAHAVGIFYSEHGQLPLPGAVPDMKARSADYIRLQNIYKSKAREDAAEVTATVRELEKQTKRSPQLAVDEASIINFCKGAAHISLVRGRPFQIAGGSITGLKFTDRAKSLANDLTNPESLIHVYIAFLACDSFVASHWSSADVQGGKGRALPGISDNAVEADVEKVTGIAYKIVDDLIKKAGTFVEEPEYSEVKEGVRQVCIELVRAGGSELHNIASLTGGLIAQEVIKVITRQYVPVDNTCVFDGVASRTCVLRL